MVPKNIELKVVFVFLQCMFHTVPCGVVHLNPIHVVGNSLTLYILYSACMSPENAHKLMGFYMEVLILGVIL